MQRIWNKFRMVVRKISDDEVTVYAAQGSFYLMISSIPFIMLLLAVSQFILPLSETDVLRLMQSVLPRRMHEFGGVLIDEVFAKEPGPLVSVAAATTLWTASRGMAAIERSIRRVYQLRQNRFFLLEVLGSIIRTLILIFVLLFTLAVLVFGTRLLAMLPESVRILSYLRYPANLVILTLFFASIYHGFSAGNMRFLQQLPGAVFTAVGWIVFSWAFSVYISHFANYSYIYGSLAALVLLMLWLYACTMILLLGAELNILLKTKVLFGKE